MAVVGKSGAGKSTLVNMVTGIDRPTAGQVRIGQQGMGPGRGEEQGRHRTGDGDRIGNRLFVEVDEGRDDRLQLVSRHCRPAILTHENVSEDQKN